MKNAAQRINDHKFSQVVNIDIQRSTFNRNSGKKTSFNAGYLVPVYIDEVLPGDTFDMKMSFVSRLTTPIYPTMDNLDLEFFAFYCPTRVIWPGWEALNGENKSSAWTPSNPPATCPVLSSGIVASGSVADYLGLPVGLDTSKYPINRNPILMYYRIYNDWFRDQNFQAPTINSSGIWVLPSGINAWNVAGSLLPVNKPHDYFSSCLPGPQKGTSQLIPISLNQLIPVITGTSDNSPSILKGGESTIAPLKWAGLPVGGASLSGPLNSGASGDSTYSSDTTPGTKRDDVVPRNLFADGRGMNISGSTISDLRTAFQLQKLYEKDARSGSRYVEMLKAHFGVDAQDYRLQRTEYLGKISTKVGIHQVAKTSSTDATSPQGNVAAFAYANGVGNMFKKSFVEHGYIMICAVARQEKTYQQGLEKFWSRVDRFDFYYPTLANISEQPVRVKEIYALDSDPANGEAVWGYNEAWADYRYKPSQVTGGMRSGVAGSYAAYHYADYYASTPTLSDTWLRDNSKDNLDRTIAVSSSLADQIICDIAFHCKATRPMPVYSIPGMVDHF
nr:MAG: major capsid protein [Microvirus sp.]